MLGPRGSSNVRRLTALVVLSSFVAMSTPASAGADDFDERRMQAQVLYDQAFKL